MLVPFIDAHPNLPCIIDKQSADWNLRVSAKSKPNFDGEVIRAGDVGLAAAVVDFDVASGLVQGAGFARSRGPLHGAYFVEDLGFVLLWGGGREGREGGEEDSGEVHGLVGGWGDWVKKCYVSLCWNRMNESEGGKGNECRDVDELAKQ
jgi:hypothetical protein